MKNPFIPGGDKIGVVGRGMSNQLVEVIAQGLGLDKSKIDLEKETQDLLTKSAISIKNLDHAGYLYYIQRGVFLSVFCGDFEIALKFAKEFLSKENPLAAESIGMKEVSELAAMYSALLGRHGVEDIKSQRDEESVIRSMMVEKVLIHTASKLVARHARVNACIEGEDDLDKVKAFAAMLYSIASIEPFQNPGNSHEIARVMKASENETKTRYERVCAENSPASYAAFVMQVVYDYCVFVNMGMYKVTALTDLLKEVTKFAKAHNSTRLGDIPRMIEEDFEPNPQYGD